MNAYQMPDQTQETLARIKELNGGKANTLIVKFYPGAVLDEKASFGWLEQKYDPTTGQPLPLYKHEPKGGLKYRDHPWIEIREPGNKDEIRQRPMREIDKLRFKQEWEAYEEGMTEPQVGTPLDMATFLSPAQILEFKAAGLRTVENLRDMSDSNLQKFMDGTRARKKAADFLAAQEGNAPLERMQSELEQRDSRIAALEEQIRLIAEAQKKAK